METGATGDRRAKAWHAVASVVCAAIWVHLDGPLEGGEFSAGSLTGPLLQVSQLGIVLFVVAALTVWRLPRTGGLLGVIASSLALPLALYLVVPGLFRSMGGEYSVPLHGDAVWDGWAICGIVALGVTSVSGVRRLR